MATVRGPESRDPIPTQLSHEVERLTQLRTRLWHSSHDDLRLRIERAIELAECPSCPEFQADGVPCAEPTTQCERCARALTWVRTLRCELERAVDRDGEAFSEPLDF
jgi:hypothetical protein